MSTKITLDDPTESDHWIADLGVWVKNGESIQVENPVLAAGLLQSPLWRGKKPTQAQIDKHLEDPTGEVAGGEAGPVTEPPEGDEQAAAGSGEE